MKALKVMESKPMYALSMIPVVFYLNFLGYTHFPSLADGGPVPEIVMLWTVVFSIMVAMWTLSGWVYIRYEDYTRLWIGVIAQGLALIAPLAYYSALTTAVPFVLIPMGFVFGNALAAFVVLMMVAVSFIRGLKSRQRELISADLTTDEVRDVDNTSTEEAVNGEPAGVDSTRWYEQYTRAGSKFADLSDPIFASTVKSQDASQRVHDATMIRAVAYEKGLADDTDAPRKS